MNILKDIRHKIRSQNIEAHGIKEGVAGSLVTPNYLVLTPIDYRPGSKQYFENVANQLKRSVIDYKKEIANSDIKIENSIKELENLRKELENSKKEIESSKKDIEDSIRRLRELLINIEDSEDREDFYG